MTRRSIAAVVALGVVAATGIVAALSHGSLRIELSVPSRQVGSGQEVPFAISVCSNSLLPMTTADGKPFWQIIEVTSGEVVADSTHYVFTLELKRLTWGPRACRSAIAEAWDQRTWNQPGDDRDPGGLLARGDSVPPGRYRIEAGWNGLERRSMEIKLTR